MVLAEEKQLRSTSSFVMVDADIGESSWVRWISCSLISFEDRRISNGLRRWLSPLVKYLLGGPKLEFHSTLLV